MSNWSSIFRGCFETTLTAFSVKLREHLPPIPLELTPELDRLVADLQAVGDRKIAQGQAATL
jgi:hypothetical protein